MAASPKMVNEGYQSARSTAANWVGPEMRPPGRRAAASWRQRSSANPAPSASQGKSEATDGELAATKSFTSRGVNAVISITRSGHAGTAEEREVALGEVVEHQAAIAAR